MDAQIENEERIVCPYCTNDRYIVIRRRMEEDQVLVKTCRCEACGDSFEFAEDREGTPIESGDDNRWRKMEAQA